MLELRNISRFYKQKKGPTVKALDGVNLTFNERGMIFILGKSGSGKSTLLNVIGGLDKYTDGDLIIKGKSTKTFTQSEFDSYRNTMVGFIFQEYNVLDEFTVGQNIGIALELQGKKATSEAINEILNLLDMQGYANRKPNTLSGGQKQRVAIARALVKNPEIIMADEPTGALDSVTGRQLFETLRKLSKEKLIIIVTHDHEFAETYGDRIIEFSDGKIIRDVSKYDTEKHDLAKTFKEDSITIRAGYQLTNEDLAQINRFLQNNTDKTLIKVLNESYDFKETTPLESLPPTDKLPLIKSKMPFLSALKMGASALKHRTIRLVLSIILASTAFTMFGLTDTIASFNEKNTAASTMQKGNITTSTIEKKYRSKFEEFVRDQNLKMTKEDITTINDLGSNIKATPYVTNLGLFYKSYVAKYEDFLNDSLFNTMYDPESVTINSNELSSFGLKMLAGTLPTAEDEIALPEYIALTFKEYGYRENIADPIINITSYDELIGIKLDTYTITGVVDTKLDLKDYRPLQERTQTMNSWELQNKLRTYLASSFHLKFFISSDKFNALESKGSDYLVADYATNYTYKITDASDTGKETSFYNFSPLTSLENSTSDVLFFADGKTLATLNENEVLFNGNNLRFLIPSVDYAISISVDSVKDKVKAETENDFYIENFLKDYYFYYGFNGSSDVPAYTTWSESEKEMYRSYYANAFLDYNLLYQKNKYQPTKIGRSYLNAELIATFRGTTTPLILNISKYDNNGLTNYEHFVIVGMDFDYELYSMINEFNYLNNTLYLSKTTAEYLGLMEDGIYEGAVVYHGVDKTALNKFLNLKYRATKNYSGDHYEIRNGVINAVASVGFVLEIMRSVFTVIGVIFAVFAALLLINFITLSVSFKKQEIGILRAIGARGFDVASIFMNEAAIIAAINYILAVTATIVATILLNNRFSRELRIDLVVLIVGVRQFVLLFIIAFGIAALSSFIPVIRLSRKKPIDAIRGR